MASVTLSHVCKVYSKGAEPAVKDVCLEIRDKEFMVLVGPSGCGKSTTLRMVAGLEEISSGTVEIGGRVVNDVPPKDRDISMVFQNYALYPHMTVRENLSFALRLRKVPKDEIARRVEEAAKTLGLGPYMERRPKALSGGQRQRVAVGRCIVRNPAVFLFDEPLSNLDAKMRVQMRAEISMLHRKITTTMIYVTHDQIEAMTMGDRICVMKDGEVQQVAAPMEIYDNPANMFVAGFIGTPPTNFFRGVLELDSGAPVFLSERGDRVALKGEWTALARERDGRPAILGVRPEGIAPAGSSGAAATVAAAAVNVEPMGAETYLHLSQDGGESTFVAKVGPRAGISVGDSASFALDLSNAHLYDPDTEERLDR